MIGLPIVWKRLVKGGQTCERCESTFQQLESAVGKLETALRPLGIQPILLTEAIDEGEFVLEPLESNRIWMAGQPLEHWLGAAAGMSRCCSVCGDAHCRTLEIDGRTYETVPEELFIKAGLAAALNLLRPAASTQATSCCGQDKCCGR
jgi:hypothetical protein